MTTAAQHAAPKNTVRHLRFLVEEPSMKDFLEGLLPRLLPEGAEFDVTAFNGKHDLLKNLQNRLSGVKRSLRAGQRLFVVVDRDSEDCHELKQRLEGFAYQAGLVTRTASGGHKWQLVNRIVVEELEAWYFGDWTAVRAAYDKAPEDPSGGASFRDPDAIRGGTWEAFERVMKSEFRAGLRKREAARRIAEHIEPTRSSSHSFKVFYEAVIEAGR